MPQRVPGERLGRFIAPLVLPLRGQPREQRKEPPLHQVVVVLVAAD